jgi:trehalose/maltose hydrolase-like predicted phosphorylase
VLDVIGPDEYHERVNNNAFTNRMVYFVFETVRTYIDYFRKIDPLYIDALINQIEFSGDLEFMEKAMRQFYLPMPGESGIIEQFDGYFRLEDCALEEIKTRLKHTNEYWGGGNGIASPTQIIKQADLVCMLSLFPDDYSVSIKKANRDYYEPRTEHGSSLSSCMYALLSCQIGDSGLAYPLFMKSAEIDITGISKQFAGLVYTGGTHPAANGGAWLTAIHGFCGLTVKNGKIEIKPCLPPSWEKVIFSLIFTGQEYKITVTKGDYSICKK